LTEYKEKIKEQIWQNAVIIEQGNTIVARGL
jgi:hypothetical protein